MPKPSIVVVNSLVARGAVGGRASVFALERLGFPVVFLPTVILPWHPGHGRATRVTPDAAGFAALAADIAGAGWLTEVGAVLTGYFGAVAQLEPAARLIAAVKAANPAAICLCDPVIGDDEGLFQPEPLAAAIRDTLLPLADIAMPNRFELGWLTGQHPRSLTDAAASARRLGPREVVVTSAGENDRDGTVDTIVVTPSRTSVATHRLAPGAPHGTGDLLAAVYLGHRLDGAAPEDALARAAGTVLTVASDAVHRGLDEMPLAAGQDAIADPPAAAAMRRLAGA